MISSAHEYSTTRRGRRRFPPRFTCAEKSNSSVVDHAERSCRRSWGQRLPSVSCHWYAWRKSSTSQECRFDSSCRVEFTGVAIFLHFLANRHRANLRFVGGRTDNKYCRVHERTRLQMKTHNNTAMYIAKSLDCLVILDTTRPSFAYPAGMQPRFQSHETQTGWRGWLMRRMRRSPWQWKNWETIRVTRSRRNGV